ncbi:MAG: hypothetical protein CMF79_01230 [Candidatus Marinimicrobia bacterium]|jgi:hypothetical protein|nr:hypothetical protein [Candidatus Neomarinimicrobiota bacterium]|tara:strand:- start:607 stop:1092 length:486 start_codon:yes stop_codon:yes gene_type:complete
MKLKNTLIRIATPAVYSGAAFLILLVGIRTLMLTTDEGFGTIGKVTLGAILFEFLLLLLYAWTIYIQTDKETITPEIKNINFKPLKDDINNLEQSMNQISGNLKEIQNEFVRQQDDVRVHTKALEKINNNLESLRSEELKKQISEQIKELLENALHQSHKG